MPSTHIYFFSMTGVYFNSFLIFSSFFLISCRRYIYIFTLANYGVVHRLQNIMIGLLCTLGGIDISLKSWLWN